HGEPRAALRGGAGAPARAQRCAVGARAPEGRMKRPRPLLLVLAGDALFTSFFDASRRRRLSALYRWRRLGARSLTPAVRSALARTDALLTTWDSPRFDASLPEAAPGLRLVAHCGGEVKGRFARPLFDRLTITNAAAPMAPYVAELAVTFLLHAARNVDGYRESLRRPANDVYAQAHTRGAGDETVRGRTVGLVGFGRIGQAVATLLRPFGAPCSRPTSARRRPRCGGRWPTCCWATWSASPAAGRCATA